MTATEAEGQGIRIRPNDKESENVKMAADGVTAEAARVPRSDVESGVILRQRVGDGAAA